MHDILHRLTLAFLMRITNADEKCFLTSLTGVIYAHFPINCNLNYDSDIHTTNPGFAYVLTQSRSQRL